MSDSSEHNLSDGETTPLISQTSNNDPCQLIEKCPDCIIFIGNVVSIDLICEFNF